MKILHTSDWHVGKTLRGRSRADEHDAVLGEIAAIAQREACDLVIVAGDLFDTAAPGPEAERLVYKALLQLADTGATVVVLAGNHDNERRLQAVQPLLALGRVVTRPLIESSLLEIESRAGERAKLAVLPWIGKHHIVKAEQILSMDAGDAQMHYAERVRLIVERLCADMTADTVNLLAGHLALPLEDVGEEVRSAHIFDYVVPSTIFPSTLHYVALGHYHRPIEVPGPCPIRYSGAPMWLGFPRRRHENDEKGVYVVEAHPGTPATIRFEPLACKRLRTLRGSMAELEALAGSYPDDYLRVYVRDQAAAGVNKQVREWLPNAVDVSIDAGDDAAPESESPRRTGRAPNELFREYLTERSAFDERVAKLFDKLLDEAHATDPA